MADEQAFLDALAANPADDTTRLVYADWLDDRGEAAKAEYLRMVVEFAGTGPAVNRSAWVLHAMIDRATVLPREWMSAAGGRFDLTLEVVPASQKIETIRSLRASFGMGLAGAKVVSESLPAVLITAATPHDVIVVERGVTSRSGSLAAVWATGSRKRREEYRFDPLIHDMAMVRRTPRFESAIVELFHPVPAPTELPRSGSLTLAHAVDARAVGEWTLRVHRLFDTSTTYVGVTAQPRKT